MSDIIRIPIANEPDIVAARQRGRALAEELGFAGSDLTLVATAISEVARNIVQHAGAGEISLAVAERPGGRGIEIVASDQGPGIEDVELAMQDGYTTSVSLGLGLPGSKRLVDEFELRSTPGEGTTVVLRKWLRAGR